MRLSEAEVTAIRGQFQKDYGITIKLDRDNYSDSEFFLITHKRLLHAIPLRKSSPRGTSLDAIREIPVEDAIREVLNI